MGTHSEAWRQGGECRSNRRCEEKWSNNVIWHHLSVILINLEKYSYMQIIGLDGDVKKIVASKGM
jgi:hypothetical protein